MDNRQEWQQQIEDFQSHLNLLHALYHGSLLAHCATRLQQPAQANQQTLYSAHDKLMRFRRWSSQQLHRFAQFVDPAKPEAVQQTAGEVIEVDYHVLDNRLERKDVHDTQN